MMLVIIITSLHFGLCCQTKIHGLEIYVRDQSCAQQITSQGDMENANAHPGGWRDRKTANTTTLAIVDGEK